MKRTIISIVTVALVVALVIGAVGSVILAIQQSSKDSTDQQAQLDELSQQSCQPVSSAKTSETPLKGTKLANYTPVVPITELKTEDLVVGTGDEVPASACILAHYTGALAVDGVVFESSHDGVDPIKFSLDGVIVGWQEGVPGMKEGGTRRLYIPAAKAYGATAQGSIPANSDLVFDVEVISIEK